VFHVLPDCILCSSLHANLTQIAGLSVLGRSANTTGDVAAITAASDGQVFRRNGTAIGFGAIALDSANAVSGILTVPNGGTGAGSFTNNRILTGNGTGALVDEANLTFDGSTLTITGAQTTSGTATFNGAATFNTDVDMVFAGSENFAVTSVPTATHTTVPITIDYTGASFGVAVTGANIDIDSNASAAGAIGLNIIVTASGGSGEHGNGIFVEVDDGSIGRGVAATISNGAVAAGAAILGSTTGAVTATMLSGKYSLYGSGIAYIGTSRSAQTSLIGGDTLLLDSSGANYLSFMADTGETSFHGINWGDSADAQVAGLWYQHSTDLMHFYADNQYWLTVDGSAGKGKFSIGATTATGNGAFEIECGSTFGTACLLLDQDDADQEFITYEGTSAANKTNNISTLGAGAAGSSSTGPDSGSFTHAGMVRVNVNGTDYWMPYYT